MSLSAHPQERPKLSRRGSPRRRDILVPGGRLVERSAYSVGTLDKWLQGNALIERPIAAGGCLTLIFGDDVFIRNT